MSKQNIGTVIQVTGPVLDIRFADGQLPDLLNAIEIDNQGKKLVVEVAQLIGDNVARCIAMSSTDGLVRGAKAVDTGGPITVPVGEGCLGRVFNLLGEPVDDKPAPEVTERWPIHRHQGRGPDLPLRQGRQNRPVRRRRRGQNRADHGADQQRGQGARRPVGVHRRGRAHP